MNDYDKIQEQKKEIETRQQRMKDLMDEGKNPEAMQELIQIMKVANEMIVITNKTLRKILGKNKTDDKVTNSDNIFRTFEEKETIGPEFHNVVTDTGSKYIH